MIELSATLQRIASEAERAGRSINQFVLPEVSVIVACVGFPDGTAALALQIEADEDARIGKLDDVAGIEFSTRNDAAGPGRWFLIQVVDAEDLPLFGSIADKLAAGIMSLPREEALSELGDMLRQWIDFLRIARKGLSMEKQIGLWGELTALRRASRTLGWQSAIEMWVGPGRSAQDFHFGNWALEVKTTLHPSQVVKIASLEQLDDRSWDALHLVHYSVSLVDPSVAPTLHRTVEAIKAELHADSGMVATFESLLVAAGYHTFHERRYDKRGLALEATSLYRVGEGFPRILRDGLQSGVLEAKYRVALNAAQQFRCGTEGKSESQSELLKEISR